MPVYDYRCPSGAIHYNVFRNYGEHKTVIVGGEECSITWTRSPSMSVPVHHQSAPNADHHEVEMSKSAADPSSPIQVFESGMDRDVQRQKKHRAEQRLQWIKPAVEDVLERQSGRVDEIVRSAK